MADDPPPNPADPVDTADTVTLQRAAAELGVHYMTAYRYVRTGVLPATKVGSRWLVDRADLTDLRATPPSRRSGRAPGRPVARLAGRLVDGDEAGAWRIVEDCLTSGLSLHDVHVGLIGPALRTIGDDWEAGTLSVAGEHRATAVATRLVARLGPRMRPRGRRRTTVVVGAPADELHALPVAMFADLLRIHHFDVIDLGAHTPTESFEECARRPEVSAVGVCYTADRTIEEVDELSGRLAEQGQVPVIVGGRGVPPALTVAPPRYVSHDTAHAVELFATHTGTARAESSA